MALEEPSGSMSQKLNLAELIKIQIIFLEAARAAGTRFEFPLLGGSADAGKTSALKELSLDDAGLAALRETFTNPTPGRFLILDEIYKDPADKRTLDAFRALDVYLNGNDSAVTVGPIEVNPAFTIIRQPREKLQLNGSEVPARLSDSLRRRLEPVEISVLDRKISEIVGDNEVVPFAIPQPPEALLTHQGPRPKLETGDIVGDPGLSKREAAEALRRTRRPPALSSPTKSNSSGFR